MYFILLFFLKMDAPAIRSKFFDLYQRMHKWKLFQVVKVRFEKQFFEVWKKLKTNIWNLNLSEKMAAEEVTFFYYNLKNAQGVILKVCERQVRKVSLQTPKKWKKLMFEVLFFVTKLKIIFFRKGMLKP